jgi:hypothetical protein
VHGSRTAPCGPALVTVELDQFRQCAPYGFGGALGLCCWQRWRFEYFEGNQLAAIERSKNPFGRADQMGRRRPFHFTKSYNARNQRDFRSSDLGEVKLCVRNCASILKADEISAGTGNLARQAFNVFRV